MGAKEVWVPISSTNTRPEGSMLPTSVRHRLLKNSSLSAAPLDLFSAPAKGSYRPADRRFAHRNPRDGEQELGPLGVGGPRSPFEVFYEQLAGLLAQLRSLAWGLRRLQGAALVELLAVAFDRSAIDPEAAGGLGFGDALFHRFDYLLSKVQRVCSHVSTIPGATSTQPAVRSSGALGLAQIATRVGGVAPMLHDLAAGDAEHVDGSHCHPLTCGSYPLERSPMGATHGDSDRHPVRVTITSSTVMLRSGKPFRASAKVSLKVSISLADGSFGSSSLSGASWSTISVARSKAPVETIS